MDTIIALLSLKDIGLREIGIQLMIAATAQEKVTYLSTTIVCTLDTTNIYTCVNNACFFSDLNSLSQHFNYNHGNVMKLFCHFN